MPQHEPSHWIMGAFAALLLASFAITSPWFRDASGASDFGSSLNIHTPWTGLSYGNLRLIDLDADGIDEILVGGNQFTCSSTMYQLSLFHRNRTSNPYTQLNYNQDEMFQGIKFYAFFFEALGRSGSVLPDIIACQSSGRLAVLENHGGLNFSVSGVAFTSEAACYGPSTVIAVADTDQDENDEIFSSSRDAFYFFTRLPNTTLVSAAFRFPLFPVVDYPAGTFADLDGDSLKDLIWTGMLNASSYSTYIFRNVGGNFSSIVNYIDGVIHGSIAVAEFTGDGRADIVLSGTLLNGSGSLLLYENNGSMSFFRRFDVGLSVPINGKYNVAAVPLRSQATALDLVIVPSLQWTATMVSVYVNNGSGTFVPNAASWLPTEFKGAVARGPDIGGRPSFLAMGRANVGSGAGSTLVGYMDNGILISYARNLFENADNAISLFYGVVVAADFNYDGCTDAFMSGSAAFGISLQSALLAGDCSGSLLIQSVGLPAIRYGAAVFRDFDHDGHVEYFASGSTDFRNAYFYYRFSVDGIPENVSSNLPPLVGLRDSALCVGAASGSQFDDIYVTGIDNVTIVQYFLRNSHNGSFILATADLVGLYPVRRGSCAFSSSTSGADASTWMDIFSVGQLDILNSFNYMKNHRNGKFTNSVNSTSAFPGGVPLGCYLSSMVAADFNGDGRDDLFYNGFQNAWISRLYFRDVNCSMMLSSGLDATGKLTQLRYSSSVTVDIDFDGDIDLVVSGQDAYSMKIMAALLNDGTGNFTDGTAMAFGSLPGMWQSAIAVAHLTNDSMPDLIQIGQGSFCGPRVLIQHANTTASSSSTSSSSSLASPTNNSSSSSLSTALGGGLGGGFGFLLLLCACCCVLTILCCCCAFFLIVIIAIFAVALMAIVSVAIGLFAAGDAGVVFFLIRGKKGKKEDPLFDVELDALDAAALRAEAERIDEYRVVNWSDIKPIRKLGAGAFGEVLLAEWNGVEVAVKIFKNATKEAAEDFKHEAVMMAKVAHHPHVVRFIGAAFKDNSIAMVLALCSGGSLLSALEKKKLDAAAKTRILRETASALSFLHSLGIVHRDIAARNVLLDGRDVAKLADLGMSRVLEDKQGEQTTKNDVGPIRWMAPEAIRSKKYSAASDCFSFAILMVEVWSDGLVPYAHIASLVDVAMAVLNSNERPRIPEDTPLIQERILRRLWDRDPSNRPTMADVVEQIGAAMDAFSDGEDVASSGARTGNTPT